MPNLPISELPELTAITSNAEFVVAQDGVTYKVKAGAQSTGNLYGEFHSQLTQYVLTADTAIIISAETVNVLNNGVTVVDNSKFTVSSGGTYNIQISAVFKKLQGGSIEFVSVWFRKNGNNIPWSNTDVSMANNNELVVLACNILETLNNNEYIEIVWSSTTDSMDMVAIPEQINPTRPGTPSIIVTLTQI